MKHFTSANRAIECSTRYVWLLALLLALAPACADETGAADGPHALPADLGPDGKFDNYISTNAREFDLLGAAHVTLPDGFDTLTPDEQATKLDTLVSSRLSSVSRAVQRRVEDIVKDANNGITGEDAKFFSYFRRSNAQSAAAEVLGDGRARFGFEMEFVGSVKIMSVLAPEGAGRRSFEATVSDWGSNEEVVEIEIRGSTSRDAFPKYNELFADGVFDIAVHFGGDYNSGRFDLETAKWLVDTLNMEGWNNAEVDSFEALGIDSPPWTRTIMVEGRDIEVRVSIVHSDMVEAADEQKLSDAMRNSFAQADVVIYSGHAGEGAGFILDYQPRHEISSSAFATLPMADKYQIYVFDGCQTYRSYVDDILENPAKTYANLDMVTTVNTTPFSVGYQVLWEFLYWFTITDGNGSHYPLSWTALLRGINTDDFSEVHYGVHGIDDDPQLNPHASEGVACSPCQTDSDCKAGGNLCLGYANGSACGVACTNDEACGDGYRCARLTDSDDQFYIPKQCVRTDKTCP